MRNPLIYVAGPVTANPWGCVRQATEAWKTLRVVGCVPVLPQLSVLHEMVDPQPYEAWLEYDLELLSHCHGIVRLPGESKGADGEVELAKSLGLPVLMVRDTLAGTPLGEVRQFVEAARSVTPRESESQ